MEDYFGGKRSYEPLTPAHLVPKAAMGGEATYGYFPSARDIRVAERRTEVRRERECINKIWNLQPNIPPRLTHVKPREGSHTSRRQSQTVSHSLDASPSPAEKSLPGVESPDVKVVNLGAYFRQTDDRKKRHFFISPEWQSEAITERRMDRNKQTNPLKYGWI